MATNTKQLQILLTGRDEASKTFTSLQKSVSNLEKTLSDFNGATNESTQGMQATEIGMRDLVGAFVTGEIVSTAIITALRTLGNVLMSTAKSTVQVSYNMGMLASSVNEAQNSLDIVAQLHGLNVEEVNKHRQEVENLNLTSTAATKLLTELARAQIDTAKAADLARAAQNLAEVSQISSSEAIERMVQAMRTQTSLVLRQIGINKTMTQIYEEYAVTIGASASELDNLQKSQAVVNAILLEGEAVTGLYEQALNSAAKASRSIQDRITMLGEVLGNAFAPFLDTIMPAINEALTGLLLFLRQNEDAIRGLGVVIGEYLIQPFQNLIDTLTEVFAPMIELQKYLWEGTETAEMHAQALAEVRENLEMFIDPINTAGNILMGLVGVFKIFSGDMQDALAYFKALAKIIWGVAEVFIGLIEIVTSAGQAFINLLTTVSGFARGMVDFVKTATQGVLKFFGMISDGVEQVSADVNRELEQMKQNQLDTLNAIGIETSRFVSGINRISSAFRGLADDQAENSQKMKDGFKLLGDAIKGEAFNIERAFSNIEPVARQTVEGIEAMAKETGELSAKAREELASIQEKMEEETKKYEENVAKRTKAHEKSLATIIWRHIDATDKLKADIDSLNQKYKESVDKRTKDYMEHVEKVRKESAKKQEKIEEDFTKNTRDLRVNLLRMLSAGLQADQDLIAQARQELFEMQREKEKAITDIEEEKKIQEAKEKYEEDVQNLRDSHQDKLAELQEQLEEELALQRKYAEDFNRVRQEGRLDDIAQAKANFAEEMHELRVQHEEKMNELRAQKNEILQVKNEAAQASVQIEQEITKATQSLAKARAEARVAATGTSFTPFTPAQPAPTIGPYQPATGTFDRLWLSNLLRGAEGMTLSGTGPIPVVAHGGETILTREQTKGLLRMLSNYSGGEGGNREPVTVNNYINATIANDYDVDRLADKLSNSFRNKGRS